MLLLHLRLVGFHPRHHRGKRLFAGDGGEAGLAARRLVLRPAGAWGVRAVGSSGFLVSVGAHDLEGQRGADPVQPVGVGGVQRELCPPPAADRPSGVPNRPARCTVWVTSADNSERSRFKTDGSAVAVGMLPPRLQRSRHVRPSSSFSLYGLLTLSSLACGGGGQVSTEEQARRAYAGLDNAVGKSMQLGFDGFNSATSANISPQTASGLKSGTLVVTGQVDQGASANKGMRLKLAMAGYSDGDVIVDGGSSVAITYATADAGTPPALDLSLKSIPNGTFTGTLAGDFEMTGGLTGTLKLNLVLAGAIEDGGMGKVQRKVGGTTVTGTATSSAGTFQVNLGL